MDEERDEGDEVDGGDEVDEEGKKGGGGGGGGEGGGGGGLVRVRVVTKLAALHVSSAKNKAPCGPRNGNVQRPCKVAQAHRKWRTPGEQATRCDLIDAGKRERLGGW